MLRRRKDSAIQLAAEFIKSQSPDADGERFVKLFVDSYKVDEHELNWIVKHLGHTVAVHQEHYRLMSSTIERAKIAKLLVIADQGKLGKYQGKSIEELNFKEIDLNPTSGNYQNGAEYNGKKLEDVSDSEGDNSPQGFNSPQESAKKQSSGQKKEKTWSPKQDVADKIGWQRKETTEIEEYFSENINNLKVPGKSACIDFINFSNHPSNRKRLWQDVKNKIYSVIQREKRQRLR